MIIEVFTRKTGKDFAKVKLEGQRKKQLARLFNSRCHHSLTVTGTIPQ